MIIYDYNGQEIFDVYPDDSSQRSATLKGEDTLTLRFSLANYVEIPTGSYVEFEGNAYYIERPCDVTIRHRAAYAYELRMETKASRLRYTVMRNTDDGRTTFPLTGPLSEHMRLLINCMNTYDIEQSWEAGSLLQDGGERTVMYDGVTCRQALDLIADAFDTEWEVDANTISVCRIEHFSSNPLRLSYGKGNGLRGGIVRKPYGDTPPVKRLYPVGSERNVSVGTYGAKNLHMPAQHGGLLIGYDGQHYDWNSQFLASKAKYFLVDDEGYSLTYAGTSPSMPSMYMRQGQAEELRRYDDIYPKREGRVSSVVVTQDAEGNDLYAVSDATIPASLDFTQSMIPGETLQITFQSGMLAGRTFDVQYLHNAQPPFPARTFKLIPADMDGLTMPGGQFVPATGDKYGVFGMNLPDAYIRNDATHSGAEWDLLKAAVEYMYGNITEYSYEAELDPLWLIANWSTVRAKIATGTFCELTDESVQEEPYRVRIMRITQNVNNEKIVKCEFAEQPERPGIVKRRLFADARVSLQRQQANGVTVLQGGGIVVPVGVHTLYATTPTQQRPNDFYDSDIPPMNATTSKYLWRKETTTYSDGSSFENISIAAVYGDTGPTQDISAMIISMTDETNLSYTPDSRMRYNIADLNTRDLNITIKGQSRVPDKMFARNTGTEPRTVTITPPSGYSTPRGNSVTLQPGESVTIEYVATAKILIFDAKIVASEEK